MAPSTSDLVLRLLLAFVAGALIGWERESHGRPAGLRTNILACVASALAMMISEELFTLSAASNPGGTFRPDPARLGAGILTGIGFLGAGTILRHENLVRGVTTAASLWFVTVLGLAFGSGELLVGLLGLAVALVALLVLPRFEQHIQRHHYATLTVISTLEGLAETELRRHLEALGMHIREVKLSCDMEKRQRVISYELRAKRPGVFELANQIVDEICKQPEVLHVRWG